MATVTVVTTAHARVERLRMLLDALAEQTVEFELVVVADGASAEVKQVAETARGRVLTLDPGRGPAAARNAGWRAARTPLVAFTDDDCVPAPNWVEELCAVATASGNAIVQGRVAPLPADQHAFSPFARTLRVGQAGPYYQTANILYPRAALEELGGFDESYPMPAGEDTDLGWRALEAGMDIRFASDALVWHAVHPLSWRGRVAEAKRWGSAVGLVKRHPGLRESYTHRIFWRASHERLLVAVLGLAAVRRTRGLSALAVWPYVRVHRRKHLRMRSLVRWLPAHAAVDAAELAAMTRGSIRARTILL